MLKRRLRRWLRSVAFVGLGFATGLSGLGCSNTVHPADAPDSDVPTDTADGALDSFDVSVEDITAMVDSDSADRTVPSEACVRVGPEDPEHCGPLCLRCPTRANASPICAQNRCAIQCQTGFADCNGNEADGCEAPLDSVEHCGSCDTQCGSPAFGAALCNMQLCDFRCNAGWHRVGNTCFRDSIRPVLPFSGFEVSTRRPRFRWILPAGYDANTLVVCDDNRCRSELIRVRLAANINEYVPPAALPRGPLWWKIEATSPGVVATSTQWQFWTPASMRMGVGGPTRQIFDRDADGWVDLVGCSLSDCWTIQNNLVGGIHQPIARNVLTVPALLPDELSSMVAENGGDQNGDGLPEVVVRTRPGTGSIFSLDAGRPTRTDRRDLVRFGARQTEVLGDIDLDGYADFRVGPRPAAGARREFAWMPGGPIGVNNSRVVGFSDEPSVGSFVVSWLGDRDGDGEAEFLFGDFDMLRIRRLSPSRGRLGVDLWQAMVVPLETPTTDKFGAADLNGDGQTDLLGCGRSFFGSCQLRSWLRVSPDPRLGFNAMIDDSRDPPTSEVDGTLYSFFAGDLNSDGFDDVVVSYVRPELGVNFQHLYIVQGNGDGSPLGFVRPFGFPEVIPAGYSSELPPVGVGDYDRDGYDDLIMAAPYRTSLRIIRGGPNLALLRAEPLDSAAPRDTYYQISQ